MTDLNLKFIIGGASGAGKTALVKRLTQNTFSQDYKQTAGVEFGSITAEVDGRNVKIQIWDLAGQERFYSMATTYMKGAFGAILVFDITERATYDEINKWLEDARALCDPSAAMILVGNKSDLSEKRVVSQSEAEQFAHDHDLSYIETSALNDTNVREVFIRTARDASESDNSKKAEFLRQQNRGSSDGFFHLAMLLAHGGGQTNPKEAVRSLEIAAEQGGALMKFLCGLMFKDGDGVPVDLQRAARYLKMAADEGHAEAREKLAELKEKSGEE